MFNKRDLNIFYGSVLALFIGVYNVSAQEVIKANVSSDSLPINVTDNSKTTGVEEKSQGLVSPSKPNLVENNANPNKNQDIQSSNETKSNDNFDFELKMKQIQSPKATETTSTADTENKKEIVEDQNELNEGLDTEELYKESPMDSLGNSILSRIDDDLFKKMSEIEKSTTLLNLELRRERLINEVEAQKAIRQQKADERKRLEEEARLKEIEKKTLAEKLLLTEKQKLMDKEQLFEALKQRKLLNSYMNEMLVNQQEWLKEKEALYKKIEEVENEKKLLIGMFKERIEKVLEASQKNIQVAELAKANFERVVKNLRTRNEQLRKRVEADAKIIKNAKSNLYLKSKSIDELRNKNAKMLEIENAKLQEMARLEAEKDEGTNEIIEDAVIEKLSTQYAILGISGVAGKMGVELIGIDGQPITLKVGSSLPTGHTVSEIGSDYAKFSRDGYDDYLYVGKSIDGHSSKTNKSDEVSK